MSRMIQIEVPADADAEKMLQRIQRTVIGVNIRIVDSTAPVVAAPTNLGEKEREVLRLVVTGMTSQQIAKELNKSYKTIENQRGSLMRKLGLSNAAQLVAYATANGLA